MAQAQSDSVGLSAAMRSFKPGDEPLSTELRTSQRVLARVTDGIYRQPESALRELISNAYDADATRVVINTDRPRFLRITVSDDGLGMSPEVLEHVLHNIGGSSKRTSLGTRLGVTSDADTTRSPGGRPLIGKIGIGLFSVAQLTQSFQISTKVAGDDFQSVATVLLRQYSDATAEIDEDGFYEAGRVLLWTEPARDSGNQGTTITLTSVRSQTRQVLQSQDLWEKLDATTDGAGRRPASPLFHVGVLDPAAVGQGRQRMVAGKYESLPWQPGSTPDEAFRQFVAAPVQALELGRRSPQLSSIFDEYLRMVWNLGLAAPLPYVGTHPFDLTGADGLRYFTVSGRAGDEATELQLASSQRMRDALPYEPPHEPVGFTVAVDELNLKRPITFGPPPPTSAALQQPMMFVGRYRTEYKNRDRELSGGPLAFSAYLYWTPKLLPAEHSGALIRVHEASGTLFDGEFLAFPVNEERRLGQISCEVFIEEGFDGALNIDRESFNHTHPHVVTLSRWLHGALRQVIATQKRLGSQASRARRRSGAEIVSTQLQQIVDRVWQDRGYEDSPPDVLLPRELVSSKQPPSADAIVLPRVEVGSVTGANWETRLKQREELVRAVAQVLAAFDVVDDLTDDDLNSLMQALYNVAAVHLR